METTKIDLVFEHNGEEYHLVASVDWRVEESKGDWEVPSYSETIVEMVDIESFCIFLDHKNDWREVTLTPSMIDLIHEEVETYIKEDLV
jgi:hypothetical protein